MTERSGFDKNNWRNPEVAKAYKQKIKDGLLSHNSANKFYYHDPYFRSLIGPLDQLDVLDVGAGDLGLADTFAFSAKSVTALDFSHMTSGEHSGSVKVVEGTAEELQFDDNSFDLVYSSLLLHWIKNYEAAIKEQYRILRPGGRCVFSLVNPYVFKRGEYMKTDKDNYTFVSDDNMPDKFDFIGEEEVMLSNDIGPLTHYPRHCWSYWSALRDAGFKDSMMYFPVPYVSRINKDYSYIRISDGTHTVERHCFLKGDETWKRIEHIQRYSSLPLFVAFEGKK